MSQSSVEVVAKAYDALSEDGIDAFSDHWADDIEWTTMRSRWFGPDAGRAYLSELADMFDEFTTEVVELIDAGDDRVIACLRYRGRSRRAGVDIPPEYFVVLAEVADGKIARAVEYATKEEALASS